MSDYQQYQYANSDYDHTSTYLLKPVLQILQQSTNRCILDLGCGNGWLTNVLIEKGYDAYGTDASMSGIEIAKQKNKERFFLQNLTTSDLPHPLQKLQFNTILSTEVVEHLYAPRQYAQLCKTILLQSGGGELIISTPYHGYLKNIFLSLSGNMDSHFTTLWDGGHIKFWSKKTLQNLLEEAGFKITNFKGCGRLPYLWKSMIICAKIQ